ncbi:MAG: UvrB/UvrC motif-containing protein [candidate division WOR-3 bacterium]
MICENCGKNDARITLVIYVNKKPSRLFVCEECAEMLANAVREIPEEEMRPQDSSIKCPQCNLSLREFRTNFILGCPKCYEHFLPFFTDLFERVIRRTSFEGGRINPESYARYIVTIIEKLKNELQELTEKEEFKEAIKVRDKILKFEQILKWIS